MGWFTRSALCAAMPGNDRLPSIAETGLDEFLREFRRDAPPILRVGLAVSSLLYHAGPILTVYVPLPAVLLPAGLRARHMERLCGHSWYPIRSLAMSLKMIAGLCWGKDASVRARFGMAPLPRDPGSWRSA